MSVFSPALQAKITGFLGRYETKRSSILPILHAIQDEHGWVSEEQVEALEKDYGLSKVHVREVLTFYSMYRTAPVRKFQVLFCNNIVCDMMGATEAMDKIKHHIERYEAEVGGEPPFSLEGVPCLGVCDGAPAMLVNKDRYLKVTAANVDEILQKYAPLPRK